METLANVWALAAVAAFAGIVACGARMRKRVSAATIAWTIPFAAATLFFAVWCARGLCLTTPATFCLQQALCAGLGIAVLHRERAAQALEGFIVSRKAHHHLAAALPWIRDLALVALAALLSFLAMEIADNPDWASIDQLLFRRGFALVGLATACLYFLGLRRGALCAAVPIVCAVFGLVQNFLDLFKNTALLPSDVMAWKTAAAVSGGYTYTLPTLSISCIVCALAAISALALIVPIRAAEPRDARMRPLRIGGCFAASALCAVCIWAGVATVDYQQDLGVKLDYWDLRNSYHESGFLVSFIAATQDLAIDKPDGYSEEGALALQSELAALYDEQLAGAHDAARGRFADERPSVIAIMNESYSDLSIFGQLHNGYEGTFVTRGLEGASVSGWLNMSVHGGGTCNSEYEFLALSSMAFIGSGMYPYQQFSFTNIATLPAIFRGLGYETWAMHPNYPGNWSRELVYATMGFDESLFIYDFEGAEEVHAFVSDRATYDKALGILESSDGPQFVLDITMQNHGGYDTGSISADQHVNVRPDFLDDADADALDEYLSCIRASDEALEYLLDELGKLDKPVTVVFFGDHQPSLSRNLNDTLFAGEDELAHKARITKTPYFIWANYDTDADADADGIAGEGEDEMRSELGAVRAPSQESGNGKPTEESAATQADESLRDGSQQDEGQQGGGQQGIGEAESSANYLGAQLLEAIGAPLSDYEKALLYLHEKLPAVNTNGFLDEGGVWHAASEGAAEDHPYHQLQILHYLNIVSNL